MTETNRPEQEMGENANAMMSSGVEMKAPEAKSQRGLSKTMPGQEVAELLKEDHKKVKRLFSDFESAEEQEKPELCRKILMELKVHTKLEEEMVYPPIKKKDEDLILESMEEHNVADFLIGELERLQADEESFDAKVKVLGELVKHHIAEEEKEMIPLIEQTDINLTRFTKRKEELIADMSRRRAPRNSARSTGRSAAKRSPSSRTKSTSGKSTGAGTRAKSASLAAKKKTTGRAKATASKTRATRKSGTSQAASSASGRSAKRSNTLKKSGSTSKSRSSSGRRGR